MKNTILLFLILFCYTSTCYSLDWINPSESCKANNGKFSRKGICRATWADAQRICQSAGGRLASIDELKNIVTECGGVINGKNNMDNDAYLDCFDDRGFSWVNGYWSSSEDAQDQDNTWIIFFSDASLFSGLKDDFGFYVRCVKQ